MVRLFPHSLCYWASHNGQAVPLLDLKTGCPVAGPGEVPPVGKVQKVFPSIPLAEKP